MMCRAVAKLRSSPSGEPVFAYIYDLWRSEASCDASRGTEAGRRTLQWWKSARNSQWHVGAQWRCQLMKIYACNYLICHNGAAKHNCTELFTRNSDGTQCNIIVIQLQVNKQEHSKTRKWYPGANQAKRIIDPLGEFVQVHCSDNWWLKGTNVQIFTYKSHLVTFISQKLWLP